MNFRTNFRFGYRKGDYMDDEDDGPGMFAVVIWDEGIDCVEEEHNILNLSKVTNLDMLNDSSIFSDFQVKIYGYENSFETVRGRVLAIGGKICYTICLITFIVKIPFLVIFILDNIHKLDDLANAEENRQSLCFAMKWRQLG